MKELIEIIKIADPIASAINQNYLNNVPRINFSKFEENTQNTYIKIAKKGYSFNYIKQNITSNFWQPLFQSFKQKIFKRNIRSILKNEMHPLNLKSKTSPNAELLHTHRVIFQPKKRIFLAYCQRELDASIAQAIAQSLTAAGYDLFMGSRQSIFQGKTWTQNLEAEYQRCDYFLLLFSEKSLISELATEVIQRAITIRSSRHNSPPIISVIRVNMPSNSPVSHVLQNYLNQIQQWEWHSQEDTSKIITTILNQLNQVKSKLIPPVELSSLIHGEQVTDFHQLLTIQNPTKKAFFSPLDRQPLPCIKPQLPDGSLSITSPFYIERVPYQQQCYQAIVKPGALIRINAPRQMGKTSLLNRILAYATAQNYHTVLLDFKQADTTILTNLEKLLRWFCANIAWQLNLPLNLNDYWDENIGPKASSTVYLQSYLLKQIHHPIVIALEEVSEIFQEIPVVQDFFTLLRSWHEKAKINSIWAKVRLIMVQSTEAYIPLSINQSPLNVGLGINLPNLNLEEVATLVKKYQLNLKNKEIGQLMQLVQGHPYLIRLSLYHLSGGELTVTQLLETAATDTGIYSDHLHPLLWKLQQRQDLAYAFKRVLLSSSPVQLDYQQGFKLKSLGLVSVDNEQYTLSCRLYQLYFSERLLN